MTLIGETSLVGDIGNTVPGTQSVSGILNAGHIDKAGRSQAGILLKGANQGSLRSANSCARVSSVGGS
ncbi:Uncharacterised protein [Salmonella enterica subsp. arizonae]|uniref:Uncharacterized protein n=1 Tax=Salmonella enterica subsp. arizonae TaxID=59203 RepID=A0A2X4TKN5_SALER|nr:Uncharacterised protein [Salmonella enterica subsp. arizonae]